MAWRLKVYSKMKKHRLSFAQINILDEYIAEVIIDKDTYISLEMMEEFETFVCNIFNNNFGIIVNKIYPYTYSLEVKLSLGSVKRIKSIASIHYSKEDAITVRDIINMRAIDKLNIKQFNGLELGRQQAFNWLLQDLA